MGIEAFGLCPSHPLCYAMLCYAKTREYNKKLNGPEENWHEAQQTATKYSPTRLHITTVQILRES